MLDTLLESRGMKHRSVGGAIVSICAHTGLIAAAVYATAEARSAAATSATPRPVYYSLPAPLPHHRTGPRTNAPRSPRRSILPYFDVPAIDVKVPSIEMSGVTKSPSGFAASGTASDSPLPARTGVGENGEPFRADQVEKQVALRIGNAPPKYPVVLQDSGVEGTVLAMFVVDEEGRVEDSTVNFVRSNNYLFEDAVRLALRRMRFIPAEVGGKTVRQLVQMPFVFTLQK